MESRPNSVRYHGAPAARNMSAGWAGPAIRKLPRSVRPSSISLPSRWSTASTRGTGRAAPPVASTDADTNTGGACLSCCSTTTH